MAYLAAFIYILFPSIAALFLGPTLFAVVCVIIGPLNIAPADTVQTPFGVVNILSIKALGILIGCVISLLFFRVKNKKLSGVIPWPHLAFVLFCAASIFWAPSLEFSIRSFQKILIPVLFFFVCFNSAFNSIQKLRSPDALANAIIGTALFMSLISVILKVIGFSPLGPLSFPVIGQAVFSGNIAIAAGLAFARFMVDRKVVSFLLWVFFVVIIVGAFVRISIAAVFAGMAVVLFIQGKGIIRIALPMITIAALIALFVFVPEFKERMFLGNADIIRSGDILSNPGEVAGMIAGSGRYDLWDILLTKLFWPDPIFGSGVGAVQWTLYKSSQGAQAPHSDYVRILCDTGVIGLALFVAASAWYYKKIGQLFKGKAANSTEQKMVLGAAAALTVYLVFMATDNAFDYVTQLGIQVFGLIGGSFVIILFSNRRNSLKRN